MILDGLARNERAFTRWLVRGGIGLSAALAVPAMAQGQAATLVPDSGDTAWMLAASALVLFMTLPGLALFYGGLVRARNLLSVMMHCFAVAAVASLIWGVVGYSIAFAPGTPWTGGALNVGLSNLALLREGMTVPESAFVLFQMMFAIITPALMIGTFVERVRFGWLLGFSALWSLLVYAPVAHWVWGGGWLAELGTLDYAGGIVVHTTAGVSSLVIALLIGRRNGFPQKLILPHSPALTMVGAGMLWVGWFGFNGGSALGAGDGAASAMLNTHFGACAAALTWIAVERIKLGRATTVGIATGAIAGLATVTPAAGMIGPIGAMAMGVLGALVCFAVVILVRHKWHIDDSLDVFAVHGVGGMLGSLLLAPFASAALGGAGYDGELGVTSQFVAQAVGVGAVALWSAVVTLAISLIVAVIAPMRVSLDAEREGLDISSHGERAWEFD
ncbi:MAG TPA: ammonium transporter [Sphingobium sp.]